MVYIGTPPQKFTIPVTLGADREFSVNRKDVSGSPVDWAAEVYISIDINKTAPTKIDAVVDADVAVFLLPFAICDQVKSKTTAWRMYMKDSATQRITPICIGDFERDDGRVVK